MCQYCGCHENTIIGRLAAEHDRLIDLTGDMVRALESGDDDEARTLAERARALLHPHTRAEEAGLFTALRAEDESFVEPLDRLCAEHVELDGLIDRIVDGEVALGPQLVRALRAHIDREENSIFPASVVTIIDGDTWDAIEARDAAARGGAGGHAHAHTHDHPHPH